jgi:hypothetical protein
MVTLNSEIGIDYTQLQNLLERREWERADRETRDILVNHAAETSSYHFSFEKFPCKDLYTLDLLWSEYSKGRFGFSIQKQIWESVAQSEQNVWKAMTTFVEKTGWKQQGNNPFALVYSDLIQRVKTGHPSTLTGALPANLPFHMVGYGDNEWTDLGFREVGDVYLPSLVSRLLECQIH